MHDFLQNFWRTAVEFCTFMFEGVNHCWQPSPRLTYSSCMFRSVRRPIKIVLFLTLGMCCSRWTQLFNLAPQGGKSQLAPLWNFAPSCSKGSIIVGTRHQEKYIPAACSTVCAYPLKLCFFLTLDMCWLLDTLIQAWARRR